MPLAYHFEPGSARDGVTMTVPLIALNQINAEESEWLVPGMLKEKVHLLLNHCPKSCAVTWYRCRTMQPRLLNAHEEAPSTH